MNLNIEQERALKSEALTTLVIAGPGSGKTRTLIERIKRIVKDGADPAGITAITFTNAAAAEMQTRLIESPEGGITLGFCGTLHSFMLVCIRERAAALNLPEIVSVIDDSQAEGILKDVIASLKYSGSMETLAIWMAKGIDHIGQGARMDRAELVAAEYFRRLLESGMLDFDLILEMGLKAVHAGAPSAVKTKYLFVDEMQDSADRDLRVYMALSAQPGTKLFIVGDPDQSIYGFRKANVGNILAMAKIFPPILLEGNYRCGMFICRAAQELIRHNANRIDKQTLPMGSAQSIPVELNRYPDAADEMQGVLFKLREMPGSAAILCRFNHDVIRFREACQVCGVKLAGNLASQRPKSWKRIKAFIALLVNPENDLMALQYLKESYGKARADTIHYDALQDLKSLNAFTLKLPLAAPVTAVPGLMRDADFIQEDAEWIEEAIEKLRPKAMIADLAIALSRDNFEAPPGDGLTVCTIHGAKGREWDNVFMPCMDDQNMSGKATGAELEENRRICYVGVTRARHRLIVSWADKRAAPFRQWETIECQESRFIKEMGLLYTGGIVK